MPEMPLDILFEIFAFLHPRDLLNLARATREFRALLMSRQSARFWREARQQVEGLPDLPSYLSEPEYANLLFFPHCHNCLKPNVHNVLWTFSARYCDGCQVTMFMDQKDVSTLLVEVFDHASFLYVNSKYNSGRFSGLRYHKPEIDEIKRKWATLRDDEEKRRFREERKTFITECQQFSREASEWQTGCKIQRSQEGHKLKVERFEAVKQKLREEGFGEVLDHLRLADLFRLKKLGSVNRPSKLTDKGWKSIRSSVIQHMVPLREKYCQELKQQATQARIRYLRKTLDARQSNGVPRTAESDREPGFFELAMMPAFQTLLRDESTDVRDEAIAAQLDLPGLIETWTNYYKSVFVELTLLGLGESSTTLDLVNLLDLAIVHFRCTRCKRRQLRWPHVLSHRCFRDTSASLMRYVSVDPSFVGYTRFNHDAPYRGEELARFDDHLEVARDIIRLAGLAPDSATYADMQAVGTRFLCRGCPISTKKTAYDWQAAIQHSTIIHSTDGVDPGPVWEPLPSNQAAVVQDFEWRLLARNSQLSELEKNPLNVFGCAQCPWHGDILSMKAHLHFAHPLWAENHSWSEGLYLHEDSKPCGMPTVWMYPSEAPRPDDVWEGFTLRGNTDRGKTEVGFNINQTASTYLYGLLG
ncbi:hypothetical protein GSI_01583 [Ganoderma sinense ZZ0214-1]|uniref:F-box domain-containing protein n=1 Tax=Ganoderma sinense ZZ0214-1 TaxID=1077348 RepID=A0A2G8SQC7_9APHY|nr:hypothetical protein GSI_01583 [Ganoderma sinense ZZ0214-1]